MRLLWTLLGIAALAAFPAIVQAEIVGGVNWADDVVDHSANIQNYGGTMMSESTEFWAVGAPDADADGNGYAFDSGDHDYVAGWRTTNADQYLIVYFKTALTDVLGDDLTIRLYGGGKASATVLASSDGEEFTQIGSIGGGTEGRLRDEMFDFNGLLADEVHYVKVSRATIGPGTGMFFDAFGGMAIPEPGTFVLFSFAGLAGLLVCAKRTRKG